MLKHPEGFGGIPDQDCLRGDLVIQGGHIQGMRRPSESGPSSRMVIPKLTECHVHLDKCHTISRMGAVGGDLSAAIAAQTKDRETWTADDIRMRANRGLSELIDAGCQAVRTHVDWGDFSSEAPSKAWAVLTELAQEYRGQVSLQVAPLIGADILAQPEAADTIGRLIAASGDTLGGFVLNQRERLAGIQNAFRVAEKYGLALDFHVDEGLDDGLDGLTMIAETAAKTGFQGPVLCGHACSLTNLSGDPLNKQLDLLFRSGVTVVTLPATNLYLQGRTAGTPEHRGLTRVRELRAAGVPVAVGTDNVQDAFCPLGRHDPRQALAQAALAAHLDPPFGDYLPMITTIAAKAIGQTPTYVDGAETGDLLLFDAASTSDLIAGMERPQVLADVLQGEAL